MNIRLQNQLLIQRKQIRKKKPHTQAVPHRANHITESGDAVIVNSVIEDVDDVEQDVDGVQQDVDSELVWRWKKIDF